MRIRNKELRQRRHRKEQRIKELVAQAKVEAKSGGKVKGAKSAPAPKKVAAPKAEAKPVEETVEAKPKRAPKKKAEEVPTETAE